jgi:hypothetical protein
MSMHLVPIHAIKKHALPVDWTFAYFFLGSPRKPSQLRCRIAYLLCSF